MSQETIISNTEVSFKDFLFKNKRNRTILWIAAAAIVIQFAVFKYFYPFASYIHGDSFNYINAAHENLSINTYLIGYSKFIRLFSVFSKSDLALVCFQYLFIQFSVLFLLFTMFYFYTPKKVIELILLCFIVFNPLFWHMANLISSDGIFLGLSMIWFTQLIWIIYKPSKQNIIWHAVILFLSFTVRYNAIIYPLISFITFLSSKLSTKRRISGLGLGLILCGLFALFTSYQYQRLTGYFQYSPFSGWQLANNAMYAYRYVDSAKRKDVPKRFQALDRMIRDFFDSTRDVKKFPSEKAMASTYYMWTPNMPLFKYRDNLFVNDTTSSELKKWASMGPLYKEYGLTIIQKYPWHFVLYFIWPNANKYYAPPVEFLQGYNSGNNFVTKKTQKWFGYNDIWVKTRLKDNVVRILDFYPILTGIANIVMLVTLICFLILREREDSSLFAKTIMIGAVFWFLNAAFTIFASSAALRFQSFPILLTTIFSIILIDWIVKKLEAMDHRDLQPEGIKTKLRNEIATNPL